MIETFRRHIIDNHIFAENEDILVAVSGGVDSVVLLQLMSQIRHKIGVAHCNFNLRGKESDGDEMFVRELAAEYKIPCFVKQFDTHKYAEEQGISIQMAARDLRFAWFYELMDKQGYQIVVLGHHRDDVIETFFINLSRGTGIRGLTGIKCKAGRIVRPLLFASRAEILRYANQQNLSYREDSSNAKQSYHRNKLRHSIIPKFKEINSRFEQTMTENIDRMQQVESVYTKTMDQAFTKCCSRSSGELCISIPKLKEHKPIETYLFEFIREFGFTNRNIPEILNALDRSSGKIFVSPTHRLLKDRENLIVSEKVEKENRQFYIEKDIAQINTPFHASCILIGRSALGEIKRDSRYAYLDYDKLIYPLVIRKWKQGESFMPLGMNSLKKLSDFFIDQKMSMVEKEKTWILASGLNPVWIVGKRIDQRYRITDETKKVLVMELELEES